MTYSCDMFLSTEFLREEVVVLLAAQFITLFNQTALEVSTHTSHLLIYVYIYALVRQIYLNHPTVHSNKTFLYVCRLLRNQTHEPMLYMSCSTS